MNRPCFAIWTLSVLLATQLHAAPDGGIRNSLHNLSSSGPGKVRAMEESQVCVFCHTSHSAAAASPLWNRYDNATTYQPYQSTTAKAQPGQPSGASKMCLSCHDGTVALGKVRNREKPIRFAEGTGRLPPGKSHLGRDLSDDHPVSITYDNDLARRKGQLRDPDTLDQEVQLDHDGQMQCTTCHDPHNNQFGKFLVKDDAGGGLCLDCHDPAYWSDSVHARSTATWNRRGENPWPHSDKETVRDNACANCHRQHGAGGHQRLLTHAGEETNCLPCHNGNVAKHDIEREMRKYSGHNVFAYEGIHDPAEDLETAPPHVECVDCHNPHAVRAADVEVHGVSGPLLEVAGVTASGAAAPAIQREAELCYRCHGDQQTAERSDALPRQFAERSMRRKFQPSNASFHPLESAGRNRKVPSLINGFTENSTMSCSDCHNNDQGPGAGGNGPRGPHGSRFPALLERRVEREDGFSESAGLYAMCYKCHNRGSILGDQSFPGHRQHIVQEKISCLTCHDPHGVQDKEHLINFNLDRVNPFNGEIEYENRGEGMGGATCTLSCHGVDHDRESYEEDRPKP